MLTTKLMLIVSATLLALLVGAASMVILIDQILPSDHDSPDCCAEIPSVEEEPRYSSAEAAAMVREKLAEREYTVSSRTRSCLIVLPDYISGEWIPDEKAHELSFQRFYPDEDGGTRSVRIKYFESSDTVLLSSVDSDRQTTDDDEIWKSTIRGCL